MLHEIPLVTIAIPAYNHERYVKASIRSVLEQDYPRIELVLVDDGSHDDTWATASELETECRARLERVVFCRNESNQGTCDTLNRLCSMSTGAYFMILASDDMLLPGAVSHLVKPMLDDPSVGVVVGRNRIMDGEGRICFWDENQNNVYDADRAAYFDFNSYLKHCTDVDDRSVIFGDYAELLKANYVVNGYLIRRNVLNRVLPFRKEAPLEDWWLHLQLVKMTQYRGIVYPTFLYRWHSTNTAKQRERMIMISQRTLEFEEKLVFSMPDRKWRDIFEKVVYKKRRLWGVGGILYYEQIKALGRKWHKLHVFGFCLPM